MLRRRRRHLVAPLLHGRVGGKRIRAAMLTFVVARLSRFQRHHARERVYALRRDVLDTTSGDAVEVTGR